MADSLDDLGVLADSQGDVERAAALFDQALALCADVGDAWGRALVLSNKGYLAREQGEDSAAATLHDQSLALFRSLGDRRNVACTLNNLGEVCCDQGDHARAAALCDESPALRRALGDRWGHVRGEPRTGSACAGPVGAGAGALRGESGAHPHARRHVECGMYP